MERRACLIDGEIPGYFHAFSSCDQECLKINMVVRADHLADLERVWKNQKVVPWGCEMMKVSKTYAIVEHLNGAIECITPVERIRFTDNE